MNLSSEVSWLCRTAVFLGNDLDLVQGTGGNISVKLDEKRMAVKASGVRLRSITESEGYLIVDFSKISELYSGFYTENHTNAVVQSSVVGETKHKPSIETGFHSFLDKYVVHLHPACFNLILCSNGAKKLFGELLPDGIFVKYRKVGHCVSEEIRRVVDKNGTSGVFLLENHGIIISSPHAAGCREALEPARSSVRSFASNTGIEPFKYNPPEFYNGAFVNTDQKTISYVQDEKNAFKFLFPDAAIFLSGLFLNRGLINVSDKIEYKMESHKTTNVDEILSVHVYFMNNIPKFSALKLLTETEVEELLGMESEKHRMRLAGV